jgi:hypothetical protein
LDLDGTHSALVSDRRWFRPKVSAVYSAKATETESKTAFFKHFFADFYTLSHKKWGK